MTEGRPHISMHKRSEKGAISPELLLRLVSDHKGNSYAIPGNCQVESCHFFPQAKQAIFEWAAQSLQQDPAVEVGGFLLGQYAHTGAEKYQLVIKHFVAAEEVTYQSANRLRLGPAAMLALDDALVAHSEDVLLGWFHTHPGHTPFFSEIDLATHHAFFKAAYHVAMVTDPCQDRFPTVILAKKENGDMTAEWNDQDWIQWKDSEI